MRLNFLTDVSIYSKSMDWESTPVPGTQLEDSELKENFKLTYFYGLSFSCRERIFKKDFEGETLNGAEEPEKNKDQGMQKLYLPKTSRGNRAGEFPLLGGWWRSL